MSITIRIDSDNGMHCHMTIFVNGAKAGKLCMRSEEAFEFTESIALEGGKLTLDVPAGSQFPK
jgi:hypothetical protein